MKKLVFAVVMLICAFLAAPIIVLAADPSPPADLAVCDMNGDGRIDTADLVLLTAAAGQSVSPGTLGDPNGDGLITGADQRLCASKCTYSNCVVSATSPRPPLKSVGPLPRLLAAAAANPCDLNGDGVVSPADLAILRQMFGWSVAPYALGDPNGDGIVNIADYRFCQLHQTATAP